MMVELACREHKLEPPVLTARPPLPPKLEVKGWRRRCVEPVAGVVEVEGKKPGFVAARSFVDEEIALVSVDLFGERLLGKVGWEQIGGSVSGVACMLLE